MIFKRPPSASTVNSLIGVNTDVVGNVRFRGGLRVEGTITGDVIEDDDLSTLVIVKGGHIIGSIKSSQAVIDGPVDGSLVCDTLDLLPNARINGDISYRILTMKVGAEVTGKLTYRDLDVVKEEEPDRPLGPESNCAN